MSNHNTTVRICQDARKWKIKGNVKHIYQGKHLTIRWREFMTRTCIKRLDKHTYAYVERNGEVDVREYKHTDVKAAVSARKAFDNLKTIIRTNFNVDVVQEAMALITLHYKANMQDRDKLYRDFDKFYKRLKYHFDKKFGKLMYVAVAEPQGRGAWHIHLMLKRVDEGYLWIDFLRLKELWGHGGVFIQRLKGDDVGQYYSAYFTAMTTTDHEKQCVTDTMVVPPKKKIIKGSRLRYYPPGMRMYRCTRNIERPAVEVEDEIHIPDGTSIVFSQGLEIIKTDADTGKERVVNRVYKAEFKALKDKSKAEFYREYGG